ncbi:MAG: NYN domain-containing protein [Deltaproteobacteria bacterium]|nr:NYN domain-containing protein [Deltaproteobacteria bacterium]
MLNIKRDKSFEEKETDVNIAISIVSLVIKYKFNTFLLFSADSDLIPVIEEIKNFFQINKLKLLSYLRDLL